MLWLLLAPCLAPGAEEAQIITATGTLQGTLEVPESGSKSCAVLIIPGSGPTDRNGNSAALPGKNNSLTYVAEALLQQGIPSLRIDKRGVGASKSALVHESDLRFETYAQDVIEWVHFLRTTQGYAKVVLLGHSEGSLLGMLVAEKEPVDAYISLEGPGRPASGIILDQVRTKLPPDLLKETERILGQLDQGNVVPDSPSSLDALFRPSVQPYLISWFKYDPAKEIAKLTCPTLIIQGTTDLQVYPSDAEALHAGLPASDLQIIEGMNHVLKAVGKDPHDTFLSYTDPGLPLHEKLMPAILTFLHKNGMTP